MGLFSKKNPDGRGRAIAFVDYEHWYISLDRMQHRRPDIRGWRDELAKKYNLCEIIFFGDFSNPSLRAEIPHIREVTSYIIETQNASPHIKKDFTDFIMLDHIYQKALTASDVKTFIIFSGDGHFSSVVSFLITQCRREVGVYGVKNALSAQLVNTATWSVEVDGSNGVSAVERYSRELLANLDYIRKQNLRQKKQSRPTFWGTVDTVARLSPEAGSNPELRDQLAQALRELMDKGYVYQLQERVEPDKSVKVLYVDWDKVRDDGLYE